MTPEVKAKSIAEKFYELNNYQEMSASGRRANYFHAKDCARVCVDEILSAGYGDEPLKEKYWNEVKEEINKL